MSYSEQFKTCNSFPQPSDQELASVSLVISYSLLQDIILLETRAYSMKYVAKLKRETLKKTEVIEELIESKIDSEDPNNIKTVNRLKEELQEIENERDTASA